MKAYFLTSPYLSDKQIGIQTAHAAVDLGLRNHDIAS
jgi:hypothetical protein